MYLAHLKMQDLRKSKKIFNKINKLKQIERETENAHMHASKTFHKKLFRLNKNKKRILFKIKTYTVIIITKLIYIMCSKLLQRI